MAGSGSWSMRPWRAAHHLTTSPHSAQIPARMRPPRARPDGARGMNVSHILMHCWVLHGAGMIDKAARQDDAFLVDLAMLQEKHVETAKQLLGDSPQVRAARPRAVRLSSMSRGLLLPRPSFSALLGPPGRRWHVHAPAHPLPHHPRSTRHPRAHMPRHPHPCPATRRPPDRRAADAICGAPDGRNHRPQVHVAGDQHW